MNKESKPQINVGINSEVFKKLSEDATKQGKSPAAIIRQIVNQHYNKQ
ncbi:hypothetical protein K6U27_04595 [Vibrio fluvialis]|nr:hypothetical protein [Vibrio fluvialis]MCG6371975.1 hypothetical protein [Vibrio fluvialis]